MGKVIQDRPFGGELPCSRPGHPEVRNKDLFDTHERCLSLGREYTIPSPLQRFLAETVDFFILFCVKATIVLWIMHLSGMK